MDGACARMSPVWKKACEQPDGKMHVGLAVSRLAGGRPCPSWDHVHRPHIKEVRSLCLLGKRTQTITSEYLPREGILSVSLEHCVL